MAASPPSPPPMPAAPPKPHWDPEPEQPHTWLRPTIRIRLTLLYGGMFLIAGILLLSIIYLFAANALKVGSDLPFEILSGRVSSDTCHLRSAQLPADELNRALNECVNQQRQHP